MGICEKNYSEMYTGTGVVFKAVSYPYVPVWVKLQPGIFGWVGRDEISTADPTNRQSKVVHLAEYIHRLDDPKKRTVNLKRSDIRRIEKQYSRQVAHTILALWTVHRPFEVHSANVPFTQIGWTLAHSQQSES